MFAVALVSASASVDAAQSTDKNVPEWMKGRPGSILGSESQIEIDERVSRLISHPRVRKGIDDLVRIYEGEEIANLPDARKTLRRGAEANAGAALISAIAMDPDRPNTHWGVTAPHSWGGAMVPLSGIMIDNPDNIYRNIPVDGAASYVVSGRIRFQAPSQQTLVLHNERSGGSDNQEVKSQETEDGSVSLSTLPVDRDGRFTVTIDSSPANGRLNHIQSDPTVHNAYIIVRDTLVDWSRENPVELSVERTAGPPITPPATDEEIAERAAVSTVNVGRYFLQWVKQNFYKGAANTITHGFDRASGWGLVRLGWYNLASDEALIVRVDRKGAAYLGFQLSDVWGQGQSGEYIGQLGSLNGLQAIADKDANYTFVIANQDPGVHNWLDTGGLHAGTFGIRWQELPRGVDSSNVMLGMKVVKLADLKANLPAETVWMTPETRKAQIAERLASFARRLQY